MAFCLVIISICGLLFFVCQLFLKASPESTTARDWVYSLCDNGGGVRLLKYSVVGLVVCGMLFSVGAAADDMTDMEPTPSPPFVFSVGGDPDDHTVLDPPEDYEPVEDPVDPVPDPTEEPVLPPDPTEAPEVTPEPEETPIYTPLPPGTTSEPWSPSPTAVPQVTAPPPSVSFDEPFYFDGVIDADMETYEMQVLNELARIEAYMTFMVVVVLGYFCYKFLRIFF